MSRDRKETIMNQIIIAGNIGKVELKETAGGRKYTRFSIGHHYRNKDGSYETGFMNLVAFGKTAENLAKFQPKTAMEFVAHFVFGSYTNKEGKEISTVDYVVDTFALAGNGAYIDRKGGDNKAEE